MSRISKLVVKIIFTIFILITHLSLISTAQDKSSVLWRISGNGLQHESYLFGTIHTVSYDVIKSYPVIKEAITKAQIGLFEQTMEEAFGSDSLLVSQVTPPLDSLFTKDEYALVDSFFIAAGYESIKAQTEKVFILDMVKVAIASKNTSTANFSGIAFDTWIEKSMIESGKKVIQLDDHFMVKDQMERTTPKQLASFLVRLIFDTSSSKLINEVLDVDGYITTMSYDLMLNEKISSAGSAATLYGVEKRNLFWLPKIEEQLKNGSCFIAAGVGHLQYDVGLVTLLKKKGYKLTPIVLKKS